ncbi:MAG: glycosyltransferase, partial [Ignavibacteria bacterium]|nr:glycosyltransferase [Ignavibacteria bacterium]
MKKNILLHDYGGYSFIYQLAKQLGLEHNITYIYCSGSGSSKGNVYQDSEGLCCIDLNDKPINKTNFITRLFVEIKYGKKLLEYITSIKVDAVLSANTPVIPQYFLQRYCQKNQVQFIFWLQDIISLAVKDVLGKKSKIIAEVIYRIWKYFEKKALKNSDRIVVISEDFTDFLQSWKIDNNKIEFIPNWSSITDVVPKEKINNFSLQHNITSTFNIVYSGTLGYKHNPDILYKAASKLSSDANIKFIIISEGFGADRLNELNSKTKLENLILLPYQPHSILPEVLASADVILSILEQS